jgi:hypothetical protein
VDQVRQALGLERVPAILVPDGTQPFYGAPGEDSEGSQSFTVPNGVALDGRVSFPVGSCIVDNNTSAYANIPDATKDGTGRWVPPGTGAAIPILGNISRARINWSAPPGRTQPTAVATEVLQAVFLAAKSPPGFGISTPTATSKATAFAGGTLQAIGTYSFTLAAQTTAKGIIVYLKNNAGAGSAAVTLFAHETITGFDATLIAGTAISAGNTQALNCYPGLTSGTGITNSIIGQTPRISVVVTVGTCDFTVTYELIP